MMLNYFQLQIKNLYNNKNSQIIKETTKEAIFFVGHFIVLINHSTNFQHLKNKNPDTYLLLFNFWIFDRIYWFWTNHFEILSSFQPLSL